MSQKQKGGASPEEEDFSTGFQIPRSRSADSLREALQAQHQEETEQDAKQGKPQGQRRGGQVCICDDPGCRIGPMKAIGAGGV